MTVSGTVTDEMVKRALETYFRARSNSSAHENMRAALTAALSDQAGGAHEWHMKQTTIPDEMFKRPVFVADALRKMVANCVSLHAAGSSLYTDGERKAMLAAAEHIEAFVSAAPSSLSEDERNG